MSNKIRSATDQRSFTIVYDDFLESTVLDHYEKLIFIAIKKFTNETLKAFPSLKKLSKMTGISESKVRRCIEHMQELGVLEVERRYNSSKGNQTNLYTLFDFAEVWQVENKNDIVNVVDQVNEAKMISELKAKGYIVTKAKESIHTTPTKAVACTDSHKNHIYNNNNIASELDSQVKYDMEIVRAIFDYSSMLKMEPLLIDEIESVMNILFDTLNTKRRTIRVSGEDKDTLVVISKLLKLDCYDIIYCIKKFSDQTEPIKNTKAYMLTLLYNAREQANLELINKSNRKN